MSGYVHDLKTHGEASADHLARILYSIFKPVSVIDVGCGLGAFVKAFKEFGVKDAIGLDLPSVSTRMRLIPKEMFYEFDLTYKLNVGERYDMALCLEVAEHVPIHDTAQLVDNLCRLAPIVVFSAALPHQRGQGHINCHPPDWWRLQFEEKGYRCYDHLRDEIWHMTDIPWWYRQNIMVFGEDVFMMLDAYGLKPSPTPIRHLIHPEMHDQNIGLTSQAVHS